MELVCRGSDVRALKGFIAAALSGKELTFVPMVKSNEGYGGSQVVLDPKGIALSDANAIARYLGGGVPSTGSTSSSPQQRWATERWTEWEATVLAPAVAVACASKDNASLAALLTASIDAQLSSGGGGSVTGAASPTLADVVIFASLYPLLASSPEAPAAAAADLPRATVAWFDALATGNASFAAGCAAAKANASTAANLCAADGQALLLEQLSKAPTKDPSGEKFNITTAINYANGVPHMGHAYEAGLVQSHSFFRSS